MNISIAPEFLRHNLSSVRSRNRRSEEISIISFFNTNEQIWNFYEASTKDKTDLRMIS